MLATARSTRTGQHHAWHKVPVHVNRTPRVFNATYCFHGANTAQVHEHRSLQPCRMLKKIAVCQRFNRLAYVEKNRSLPAFQQATAASNSCIDSKSEPWDKHLDSHAVNCRTSSRHGGGPGLTRPHLSQQPAASPMPLVAAEVPRLF